MDDLRPDYRRINRRFAWLTVLLMTGLALVVVICILTGKSLSETQGIVSIAAWFVAIPFAMGYMGSLTTRMERKTDMSVRMFDRLYEEVHPTIENAKSVLASTSALVEQIRQQRPDRIIDFIDKLQQNGTIDRVSGSLEQIAAKIRGAVESSKDLLDKL